MKITNSKNLKKFKEEIGQANHFLITILVGLDGVKDGIVKKKKEFRTTWNPKKLASSAERSKLYAKKSALTWIVDNFDSYLRRCNEEPKLLPNSKFESIFDGSNRSVYRNFENLVDNFDCDELAVAMVDLLICWRNRLVHYKATNDIKDSNRYILTENKGRLISEHNSLEVERMLNNFDSKGIPTFKELTSLTKATIDLVYQIDNSLISKLDIVKYADRIIVNYIRENKVKRVDKLFSGDKSSRLRILTNVLKSYGFSEEYNEDFDKFLVNITNMKIGEFRKCITNLSFV